MQKLTDRHIAEIDRLLAGEGKGPDGGMSGTFACDFDSSTQRFPTRGDVPRHVAIIMDGNGRWAKQRLLPRVAGPPHGRRGGARDGAARASSAASST